MDNYKKERKRQIKKNRVLKRFLRDISDPFDITDEEFQRSYRFVF